MEKSRLHSLPLKDIHITDFFWDKYINLVKDVILPYQWDILNDNLEKVETSHCIENFKIAAKESQGEFRGAVFQDTDAAKWLEAVSYSLSVHPDPKLEQLADDTIHLIGKAQDSNGYLNTYFTIKEPQLRWTNLTEGHELYTAGHMIEAAVAYYEATGKDEFLHIVCRMADLITETFGPQAHQIHGYPGHQEIELALVKLYHITNNHRYLEIAKYFIDQRGVGENYFLQEQKSSNYKFIFDEFKNYDTKYSQSHRPVRNQEKAEGHAVRATYMYCAMADLAFEYQDNVLLKACQRLWKNLISKRMYITGGIGSSGLFERFTTDYDLPNDRNYSETCAAIGLALFGKRMCQITHDASYMDIVERALYNNVLSGIAMDGKSFFYVNPLEVWPDNCLEKTSLQHVKPVRQKWFGVACCPPNIARTLASLGQYIYFSDQDTLYLNLYIGGDANITLNHKIIHIKTNTNFPFENVIKLHLTSDQKSTTKLALRIPGYTKSFQLKKNGRELSYEVCKGYAVIEDSFTDTDLEVHMVIPACYIHANPKVGEDIGKSAIMKGPLVYCLEECDNGKNLKGIFADTTLPLEEEFIPELLGGTAVIYGKGKKISNKDWGDNELYKEHQSVYEPIKFKAIPYCYWCNRVPGEMVVWLREII